MEAAIEALNTPPVFNAEELAYLAICPTDWTKKVAGTINWEVNERVVNKGAIEWRKGEYRLTDLGKTVIAEAAK